MCGCQKNSTNFIAIFEKHLKKIIEWMKFRCCYLVKNKKTLAEVSVFVDKLLYDNKVSDVSAKIFYRYAREHARAEILPIFLEN